MLEGLRAWLGEANAQVIYDERRTGPLAPRNWVGSGAVCVFWGG